MTRRIASLSRFLAPLAAAFAVASLVARTVQVPIERPQSLDERVDFASMRRVAAQVDALLARDWEAAHVSPAPPAPDLTVLRRLSLALMGCVPSLEEIRMFEADAAPGRLERWTQRMLAGRRFADYFAERLVRVFVGNDEGPFLIFRRDRLVAWVSEALQKGSRFDALVRDLISQRGLWTGSPATNFITSAVADGKVDAMKLASRTTRAFLGQRIDCAQCHDHPFAHWKKSEFEGLAAFFGDARPTLVGVQDDGTGLVVDASKQQPRHVARCGVPFAPELLPATGTARARLAAWVTSPGNRRFGRAIANRMWGLLTGRAYVTPVDDVPDPPPADRQDVLDVLGASLVSGGYDLRRLIGVIAMTRALRVSSSPGESETSDSTPAVSSPASSGPAGVASPVVSTMGVAPSGLDSGVSSPSPATSGRPLPAATSVAMVDRWAMFGLTRLRPEQVIGALIQAASVRTLDQESHPVVRAIKFLRGKDFVNQYGDAQDDELAARSATISQRLLLLNGNLVRELTEASPFSATGRIAAMAPTDAACVEDIYLAYLSRRPTPPEAAHFIMQIAGKTGDARTHAVEDMAWSLANSTEFAWNH